MNGEMVQDIMTVDLKPNINALGVIFFFQIKGNGIIVFIIKHKLKWECDYFNTVTFQACFKFLERKGLNDVISGQNGNVSVKMSG